jgi:hypothetical protein
MVTLRAERIQPCRILVKNFQTCFRRPARLHRPPGRASAAPSPESRAASLCVHLEGQVRHRMPRDGHQREIPGSGRQESHQLAGVSGNRYTFSVGSGDPRSCHVQGWETGHNAVRVHAGCPAHTRQRLFEVAISAVECRPVTGCQASFGNLWGDLRATARVCGDGRSTHKPGRGDVQSRRVREMLNGFRTDLADQSLLLRGEPSGDGLQRRRRAPVCRRKGEYVAAAFSEKSQREWLPWDGAYGFRSSHRRSICRSDQ